ncbi:hypothetical protein HYPSUDRAFT_635892 [Hypholoma sublateritium FD-334 SS-4]|uniref:Uncharacterized protein n=1 Tax=Hypholoma sublateritium (strain FD-334 SS-4) TaxID=945553 RepID=A0A0D2PL14_HYPSF|nr:hypothetical protein HYPSUDRAFT_635892 [Hypholoma sublateritium FD-334 SS-4]
MQEGLDRGRAIGHVEPPMSAGEEDEEYTDDGLSEGGSYRDPPRRQRSIMAPSGHSRADSRSQAAPTALPVPPPADVLPVNPPSNYAPSVRAPSVRPESMRGRSPNTSHAPQSNYATSARGPSPNPSMTRPPSNYGPSIRGPSPNPSNARPPSNYAPSMRTASPNPSMIRPSSTYAPSMRGPSPNPSNARPPSTYAPSMRAASPNPSNARPSSNYAPSMRAASPGPSYSRAPSTHAPSIRAPSVSEGTGMRRPSSVLSFAPTPHHPTVAVPPDNLIPTLDTDLRIRLPPPHEFMARTPERAPSPALPAGAASESSVTSQEPLPVPLRTAAPGRAGRHRRGSSAGSGSSTLSTLELFSNPYAAGMRTPMSAIEEVSSQASPAHYEGHHGRSFVSGL